MVQLGIACITAYEGCFDLILTRSTTLIVLNGKSEGAGVAKLKQVEVLGACDRQDIQIALLPEPAMIFD